MGDGTSYPSLCAAALVGALLWLALRPPHHQNAAPHTWQLLHPPAQAGVGWLPPRTLYAAPRPPTGPWARVTPPALGPRPGQWYSLASPPAPVGPRSPSQPLASSFRTEISVPASGLQLGIEDGMLLMGSCFSENIGSRLQQLKCDVEVNPFGISYNPLSLAWALHRMLDDRPFTAADLSTDGTRYFSYQHHSSFTRRDPTEALAAMNEGLQRGRQQMLNATVLFLTFGSAWTYVLAGSGETVANCHKMPSSMFTRRFVEPEEAAEALGSALERWREHNPRLKVVLTVSPVRHWKDGAVENSLSKSALVVASHALVQRLPGTVLYFPAFEIMMDDLRDYRFYAEDMLHPSAVAVEYIWHKFVEAFFRKDCLPVFRRLQAIASALAHRPFDPASEAHQAFLRQQLRAIDRLQASYPRLDLRAERAAFMSRIQAGDGPDGPHPHP